MKTNRLFAAILALALALSLFACGEKPTETTTETTEKATETTEKVTETTEKETETTEKETETTEKVIETTEKAIETTLTETSADETTETAAEETVTEETTETETLTEETTQFDYFGADMDEYIVFESGALESIAIEISSEYLVDDSDVMEYVNDILFEYKTATNNGIPTTDAAISIGDSAFIYYKGYINGVEFEGGSNWDSDVPEEIEVGRGYFIPQLEAALVGMTPASTGKDAPATVSVTFPDDYWYEEYAGVEATFDIWVVYSVEYALPEYDADFILDYIGYEPEESCSDVVEEFESSLYEELKLQMAEEEKYAIEEAIGVYLYENSTVLKYPQSEVERSYAETLAELEFYKEMFAEEGMVFEDLGEFVIFLFELEEGADWEAAVIEGLVYPEIHARLAIYGAAQYFDVTVTDEECQAYAQRYAEDFWMTPEEVIAELGEETVREYALSEKLMTYLAENTTVSYK